MILRHKPNLDSDTRAKLINCSYGVIGCLHDVNRQLPCGLPEYVYQEGLEESLKMHDYSFHKEYTHHPIFNGKQMRSFLRMDFVVELPNCNIIIECKAVSGLTRIERQQLFSYLIGTGFPIGILVNFATYPKAEIERYYFDGDDMTITAF